MLVREGSPELIRVMVCAFELIVKAGGLWLTGEGLVKEKAT